MPDLRPLAKLCTTLSECPSVLTDGETAFVVGIPAQLPNGVGPDEAAVALPLELILAAAETHRGPQPARWGAEDVIGLVAALAILVLGIGAAVLLWRVA